MCARMLRARLLGTIAACSPTRRELRGPRFAVRTMGTFPHAPNRLRVTYPHSVRPTMVFTAGCPGSGKTYCLHEIYGLENLVMIDLDVAIQQHQDYDPKDPKRIYASKVAYEWADQAVERRFQLALREIEHGPRLICVDGTGTHVARQKRRMWAAKKAGFWVRAPPTSIARSRCVSSCLVSAMVHDSFDWVADRASLRASQL